MKIAKQRYHHRQQLFQQKQKKAFCHWNEPAVYTPLAVLTHDVRLDLIEGMMNIFCKHIVKGMHHVS